jgi:hypothetical protein
MKKSVDNKAELMKGILRKEGGYSSESNGDPETLFGITITNWTTAIASMKPAERDAYPDSIKSHLSKIAQADKGDRKELTSEFMRDIGQLLRPMGKDKSHPKIGAPLRSTEHAITAITESQSEKLEAARGLATGILFNRYAETPKLRALHARCGRRGNRSTRQERLMKKPIISFHHSPRRK